MVLSVCPCCVSQSLIYCFVGIIIFLQLLHTIIKMLTPKYNTMKLISSIIFWFIAFLMGMFAIFLGMLSMNSDIQQQFFSMLCIKLSSNKDMESIRCDLLKHVKGNVLEFGPGPATNFACLQHNTNIMKWTGVEPNKYFQDAISAEKEKLNVSFSVSTVWLKGEDVDVEPESYDYVIGTHLLCSVNEVDKVLHQITRALKPGGSYYFLEHVSAEHGSLMYYMQKMFDPLFKIVGNGCNFKPTWKYLSKDFISDFKEFDVEIEHFNAPLPIPLIIPHIRGKATKRENVPLTASDDDSVESVPVSADQIE